MSANAFRSQLMQQFAASARSQSRPPLALIGWIAEDEKKTNADTIVSRTCRASCRRSLSTIQSSARVESACSSTKSPPKRLDSPSRLLSTMTIHDGSPLSSEAHATEGEQCTSEQFQKMLLTRRTSSHFAVTRPLPYDTYWKDAIERAVECGYAAPNHKRTEPFTFKRIVGPSEQSERLASIAYHVHLKKQIQTAPPGTPMQFSEDAAQRKQEKWNKIPAFLVTLVRSHETEQVNEQMMQEIDQYDLLPYVPPTTERELEDYASASAAVQNILLSLHSENIASKWVTGPVIRTRAFRELVKAEPKDRVVALIMIGQPDEMKRAGERRRRRSLHGDVLVDL